MTRICERNSSSLSLIPQKTANWISFHRKLGIQSRNIGKKDGDVVRLLCIQSHDRLHQIQKILDQHGAVKMEEKIPPTRKRKRNKVAGYDARFHKLQNPTTTPWHTRETEKEEWKREASRRQNIQSKSLRRASRILLTTERSLLGWRLSLLRCDNLSNWWFNKCTYLRVTENWI